MMNIAELVDMYRDQGYGDAEIDHKIRRDLAEMDRQFIEDYEDDPIVQYGWHQEDIIDMYRRER